MFTSLDRAGLSDVGWSVTIPPRNVTASPTIMGECTLTAGKGKRKHFVGFELVFSEPLDPSARPTMGITR